MQDFLYGCPSCTFSFVERGVHWDRHCALCGDEMIPVTYAVAALVKEHFTEVQLRSADPRPLRRELSEIDFNDLQPEVDKRKT
jgi:hypothetical protein